MNEHQKHTRNELIEMLSVENDPKFQEGIRIVASGINLMAISCEIDRQSAARIWLAGFRSSYALLPKAERGTVDVITKSVAREFELEHVIGT